MLNNTRKQSFDLDFSVIILWYIIIVWHTVQFSNDMNLFVSSRIASIVTR